MQSLSKSKLPLKLTKILMIFVLFFSLMIQKPKETHAFPLALLLPAVTNPATVTALLGVVGLGATGVATTNSEWYNDTKEQLEQTAYATLDLMSNDMKQNLQTSLDQLINGFTNGIEISGDLINLFLNKLSSLQSTPNLDANGYQFRLINQSSYDISNQNPDSFRVYSNGQNILSSSSINLVFFGTSMGIRVNGQYYGDSVPIDESTFLSFSNVYGLISYFNNASNINKISLNIDGSYVTPGQVQTNLELDNVADHLTEQLLSNNNKLGLNLGINDLVNLKTNEGVPLYVDNLGQVVLRDGRPFEGDLENIVVSNRVPAVTDLAGTLTPTISTDFGMVNIKTGELVIPNPNPPIPNQKPNIKPETTKPLTGIQRFLPAAVVIVFILFLKAIVFYAIRLFEFILTLPLTPSKPINNYAFQWFMDAKILGIQVYDTVLAFAMFAFSLTIYKVIRRIW